MNIIPEKIVKFKGLEEKIFKDVMKLGRELIADNLKLIDDLIKKYRDKSVFKVKDFQKTVVKTRLGDVEFFRRRYVMQVNGVKKSIYLLDELIEINSVGQYSQSVVEMIIREIAKKSYRETAKTVSEDTDSEITYTAVRNIVIKLGEKIKALEEEKIQLYKDGKIEGNKNCEYVFCEHDGIYVKKQKSKKSKSKKKYKVKHFKKKKNKRKKNGIELKIAVIHEGKEKRYENDYKLKNKIIIGTASEANKLKQIEDATIGTTYKEYKIKKIVINGDGADWTGSIVEGAKEIFQLDMAHIQKKIYMAVSDEEYLKQMQKIVYTENPIDIFSLIYNYKVELEAFKKIDELNKVKELEEYLRNNEKGLQRYQYKLGYTEEQIQENIEQFPSLGSEESHMYCVCRDRMKKNRTSWSIKGAEALLKVIMNKMNNTIEDILNNTAKKKIQEELAERIPEPKKIKKNKQGKIQYAGKYELADNFTGYAKQYVLDMLKGKKMSELMIIGN
ncbi:MAG: UPF0236 family protein [Clostridia bacterium]|nr:UPF0236 family protein [Clostridia bacterium]